MVNKWLSLEVNSENSVYLTKCAPRSSPSSPTHCPLVPGAAPRCTWPQIGSYSRLLKHYRWKSDWLFCWKMIVHAACWRWVILDCYVRFREGSGCVAQTKQNSRVLICPVITCLSARPILVNTDSMLLLSMVLYLLWISWVRHSLNWAASTLFPKVS